MSVESERAVPLVPWLTGILPAASAATTLATAGQTDWHPEAGWKPALPVAAPAAPGQDDRFQALGHWQPA